jgi:hypothetical protein
LHFELGAGTGVVERERNDCGKIGEQLDLDVAVPPAWPPAVEAEHAEDLVASGQGHGCDGLRHPCGPRHPTGARVEVSIVGDHRSPLHRGQPGQPVAERDLHPLQLLLVVTLGQYDDELAVAGCLPDDDILTSDQLAQGRNGLRQHRLDRLLANDVADQTR